MPDPIYGTTVFDKSLPAVSYRVPGQSYTIPNLNVSTINGTSGGGGGGGGSLPANPLFSTVSLCDPTSGKGAVQFKIDPNPAIPLYNYIAQSAWGDETANEYQITVFNEADYTDYIGCKGVLATDGLTTSGTPFGVIEGYGDGFRILGADATGKTTATWYEAHNGFNNVNLVSSMTDSQKTHTLNFSAFLSTMADVYPAIVNSYS